MLRALARLSQASAGRFNADGSALFVGDLSTDEIYALDLELP
jgi:hypothetical protein